jgi:hypothetical protein
MGYTVVKPVISASGFRTFRTSRTAAADGDKYHEVLATGTVMVQPFLEEIGAEGEWCLVFIGGVYSHAALKRPALGGFDGVRRGDRLVLLELELLEPDLFFRVAPDSAERFAEALLAP